MKALQQLYSKLIDGLKPAENIPAQFLEPISEAAPCGDSLEYDNEFAVLRSRLEPRAEVQYGSFTSKAEEPDWSEIERDCLRLLLRSKDITLLIWYARSRTRSAGAEGVAQGLCALSAVLSRFESEVHPQLLIDNCIDPAVRANALAALCDPEGLLSDIRNVLISGNTSARLTVRDVERALAVPRLPNALDPDLVKRQLADLYTRQGSGIKALLSAGVHTQKIIDWAKANLKGEAPDLTSLQRLLATMTAFSQGLHFSEKVTHSKTDHPPNSSENHEADSIKESQTKSSAQSPGAESGRVNLLSPFGNQTMAVSQEIGMSTEQQREHIRQLLSQARIWIEKNEPSSPVAVLLKQAERLWGKRFSEVAHFIPADLLKAWDEDDDQ